MLPAWAEALLAVSAALAAVSAWRLTRRCRDLDERLRARERGGHFLAESPERGEIIRHAFAVAEEILPLTRFDLYTFDASGRVEEVWVLPEGGPPDAPPVRHGGHPAVGTALDRERLLEMTATETDRSFAPSALLSGGPPTRRLHLPLYSGDRLLAHLDLAAREPVQDSQRTELRALLAPLTASLHASRNWEIAVTDELSGLASRRYFETRLSEEWARRQRTGYPLAVACFDLDRFKTVNDTLGHPAGDCAIRAFGAAVRTAVRAADVACRYGGEEFAVLFPESHAASARTVAERIRRRFAARPVEFEGKRFGVTVSAGVADAEGLVATEREALVHRADKALYEAKQKGRNRVVSWSAGRTPKG